MKFQSYTTAWKQAIKNKKEIVVKDQKLVEKPMVDKVIVDNVEKPIVDKVIVENIEKPKPIVEKQIMEKPMDDEFLDDKLPNEIEEIKLFNKPLKDIIILGLLAIIFLLVLWNISSMNEIKRYSKNQEKLIQSLLEHVLNK